MQKPIHYVCTWEQATALIAVRDEFWLGKCGCREARGRCARSPHEVCLGFYKHAVSVEAGVVAIDRTAAMELLTLARKNLLVTRPFRDFATRSFDEGICFCCDDCCGYFLHQDEICDRGSLLESTEISRCSQCGICAPACYFGARSMQNGALVLDREACFGCGLCGAVCPENCISLVER